MKKDKTIVDFSNDAGYYREKARQNARENRELDALELMRSALEREPNNQGARLEYAEQNLSLGLMHIAKAQTLHALTHGASPSQCYALLTRIETACSELRRARVMKRHCHLPPPSSDQIQDLPDLTHLHLPAVLRKSLRAILKRKSRLLAMFRSAQEQHSVAAKQFWDALSDDPEITPAQLHAWRAFLAMMEENNALSLNEANKAFARHPDGDTFILLAQIIARLEGNEKGLALLHSIPEGDMEPHKRGMLARVYAELGDLPAAARFAEETLRYTPYDQELLYLLAAVRMQMGDTSAHAKITLERLLRMDPRDALAQYLLRPEAEATSHLAIFPDALEKELHEVALDESAPLDENLRALVHTALMSDSVSAINDACTVLMRHLGDEEARDELRLAMYDYKLTSEQLKTLRRHCIDPAEFCPPLQYLGERPTHLDRQTLKVVECAEDMLLGSDDDFAADEVISVFEDIRKSGYSLPSLGAQTAATLCLVSGNYATKKARKRLTKECFISQRKLDYYTQLIERCRKSED